ncbi:hypothetical protein ACI78V_20985 [Geodermatophilus sp. SYSU D00742]
MSPSLITVLAAADDEQLPSDVGKAGPLGLLLIVLLLIATALLVKSMSGHLKRLPASFDGADDGPRVVVPDTPAQLLEERKEPGQELLDTLRRAPLAIEPPRRDGDGRPETPRG